MHSNESACRKKVRLGLEQVIDNAYLNSKYREKIWTESGTEFGTEKGMVMIISRALYGLKISGSAWR